MQQVYQKSYLSKELCVEEVPIPNLRGEGCIVQNAASLISPGTERATVSFARKNMLEKIQSQPERVKLLLRKMKQVGVMDTVQLAMRKLEAPIPLGYSSAGIVSEVSKNLSDFKIGDRVACAGAGFANHAETIYIPKNLTVKIPENVSFDEASFVAPGAIAMQGVRLANIGLGDVVLIIGLGLIGQLTAQLVLANGGVPIGIDMSEERLKQAKQMGVKHVFNRNDSNLNSVINNLTRQLNFGSETDGADIAIITAATKSSDPIILASELLRERGHVVVVGDVGLQVPRSIFYHKELSMVVSRSYGPGRYDPRFEELGQAYPRSYVRWTQRDNMASFLELIASQKIDVAPLIDMRFSIKEAHRAYDILTDASVTVQPLGIVIDYPDYNKTLTDTRKMQLNKGPIQANDTRIKLGVFGAGNFLKGVLLPAFQQVGDSSFVSVCSQNGLSAKNVGEQFKFNTCATDSDVIFNDKTIDAVVIGTRHDSHADLIIQALEKEKHVFVEKPLATTPSDLKKVIKAIREHQGRCLMVGFNRRFSPVTKQLQKHLANLENRKDMTLHYRVNAGFIPENLWVHDEAHGGRVVGEICHFIDWCSMIAESAPVWVEASSNGSGKNQNISTTLGFKNGAIATILYIMNADSQLGKERIEVFAPGISVEINDFKTLHVSADGKGTQKDFGRMEKGHKEEIEAFIHTLKTGGEAPISSQSMIMTTVATFGILESLQSGQRVELAWPE